MKQRLIDANAVDEAIKVVENEQKCIIRQISEHCDRNCERCDIALEDNVILSAYDIALLSLRDKKASLKQKGGTP